MSQPSKIASTRIIASIKCRPSRRNYQGSTVLFISCLFILNVLKLLMSLLLNCSFSRCFILLDHSHCQTQTQFPHIRLHRSHLLEDLVDIQNGHLLRELFSCNISIWPLVASLQRRRWKLKKWGNVLCVTFTYEIY